MDYQAALEFLEDTRDMLEDVATDRYEDPEVIAEYTARIKLVNQIMDLVRADRDKQ